MKILLSGFEPFGGAAINPTERLVKDIANVMFENVEIRTVLLPVHYDECAARIIEEMRDFKPDAVISCGLYAGRSAVTPERIAVNVKDTMAEDPVPDNKGTKPVDQPINPEGPDGLFTRLPIREIVNRLLEQGIPAFISNTAGTYICNNTMYGVLDYIRRNNLSTTAGFIHFPASTEMALDKPTLPTLSHDTMLQALRIIIQTTIEGELQK
ncbi:pyroglutamyl-peptidase I [Aneurinibacillus terranovensis]|uniref:pyroglutamyl-peptidase I n=1 Tax=Aneurinibacillus terranovensis TaxID=278991 RepID=UPI0004118F33|nr:pyroglutamyl-peptidase I [Aneurinibacillus terranovensis]